LLGSCRPRPRSPPPRHPPASAPRPSRGSVRPPWPAGGSPGSRPGPRQPGEIASEPPPPRTTSAGRGQGGAPGTELGADDLGGSEDGGGHGDGVAGLDVETIGDDRHIQLGRQPPGNVPAGVGRGEEDQVGPVLCDEAASVSAPARRRGARRTRGPRRGGRWWPRAGRARQRRQPPPDRSRPPRRPPHPASEPGQELEAPLAARPWFSSAKTQTLPRAISDHRAPARSSTMRWRRPVVGHDLTGPSLVRGGHRHHRLSGGRAATHRLETELDGSAAIHRLGLGTHDAPQRGIAWLVDPGVTLTTQGGRQGSSPTRSRSGGSPSMPSRPRRRRWQR